MFDILREIERTQSENLAAAAELVTGCMVEDGILHTFGTGHSHLLAHDVFCRAGTLVPIHHMYDPSLAGSTQALKSARMEKIENLGEAVVDYHRLAPPDVLIVISNSGSNAVPVDVARASKREGVPVIALVSRRYVNSLTPRHSSGKQLVDVADVVLDNCCPIGDTCLAYEGLGQGVGAASTVAGSFILHGLLAQVVKNLLDQGIEPPVYWSGNLPEGMDPNKKYIDEYWSRIRNL